MRSRSRKVSGAARLNLLEVIGNAVVGGMENHVRTLIRHLPPDRFRITCLCPFESDFTAELRAFGCDVYIIPLHDDPPWRSIQAATELVKHSQIDVIHAHMPKAHVVAGLAGALTATPVVATVHGNTITTHEFGIYRTTGTSLIVVCQEAYTQALAMGVPPERVTLIPNGVDTQTFVPGEGGAAFREQIGVPQNVLLVGFAGRLAPEKGPDHFLRAAEQVHDLMPDVHFVLVGDGTMRDELIAMIDRMRLGDRVHLAGVWKNMQEVYPAFDVLAQTSRAEGMPLALLEAMACGVPVVALAVGGVAEVVEVGTTGRLAGPGDWAGIGNALLELLAKPEGLKAMGRAGRKRVESLFDARATAGLAGALFQQLARPRREVPPLKVASG